MSRPSTFDFQTTRRRTARFSLFALPPPPEPKIASESEAESMSELAADAVDFTSPETSPSEQECKDEHEKARSQIIGLVISICVLLLAFAAVLALQIIDDLKHPQLSFPNIDTNLAKSLHPSSTCFTLYAASTDEAELKVKSVPAGAHVGLIYTIDKCQPKQMMQLVELSNKRNFTDITLVPRNLDYAHTSACLYFLESVIADRKYNVKIKTGVMKQPQPI